MTREGQVFVGGCLCERLRYEARALEDAGYCHCRLCQRSSGAPVLAWATFRAKTFAYVKGEPTSYPSSEHGRRDFCAVCGTQIAFRDVASGTRVDINIATLDDPAAIEPEYHVWVASRLPWFEIADDLPRFDDQGPDQGPDLSSS